MGLEFGIHKNGKVLKDPSTLTTTNEKNNFQQQDLSFIKTTNRKSSSNHHHKKKKEKEKIDKIFVDDISDVICCTTWSVTDYENMALQIAKNTTLQHLISSKLIKRRRLLYDNHQAINEWISFLSSLYL